MKTIIRSFVTILVLLCFGLLPRVQAVIPPPDGGYPNFNTAEGQNALLSLTSGAANTAVGWFSLKSVTTGSFNTGVGAGTLVLNTGDENTAIGTAALLLNTASGNTAVGSRALLNNTTGGTLGTIQDIDLGPNVAVGQQALESNTVSSSNTAVGYQALQSFATGPVGLDQVGLCTAVGFQALANATGTFTNSAFGYQALRNNTEGGGNTAIGVQALFSNATGGSNVAIGTFALFGNATGDANTAIGTNALTANTDGSNNAAIGFNALGVNITGTGNIGLGNFAGNGVSTADNVICIGTLGANVDNSCYVGNIWTQPGGSQAVFVNADGKLGAQVSSRRFKEAIKPLDQASEALFALKPVSFHYKKEIDSAATSQFGLLAEDVEKVNPDLVIRDKEGNPYSVRYDQVNAMLLNEFLKEHEAFVEEQRKVEQQGRTIQEQEATIGQLRKEMETVVARLKEHDSEIQRVNDQLRMRVPAAQVVASDQ
jgi:trimeric autotransporter adhesin